ncbi:hypothetical protein [Brevibacillus porteri]|uniref:hypothetical protein n=1 Tax=Brevibacillus porteri TaxID=2126350 RepID=UPI003D1DABDB
MRQIVLILFAMLLISVGGCSANDDWVHTFTGESDNWSVVMEIRPTESEHTHVVYPFYLTKKMENDVTKLHFEAHLVNGNPSGNFDHKYIKKLNDKQPFLLFKEYPNLLSTDFPAKDTPKEQLEYYFSELKMDIKWADDRGEHQEQIPLKLQKAP